MNDRSVIAYEQASREERLSLRGFYESYARTFKQYAGVLIAIWTGYFVLESVVWSLLEAGTDLRQVGENPFTNQVINVPFSLASTAVQAPCYVWLLQKMGLVEGRGWQGAVALGMHRFIPLVLNQWLSAMAIGLGIIALIVPGIMMAIGFCISETIAVGERQGPMRSLQISWDRTHGHKRQIFLLYLPIVVVQLLLMFLQTSVEGWLQGTDGAQGIDSSFAQTVIVKALESGMSAMSLSIALVATCELYRALHEPEDRAEKLADVFA